MVRSYLYCFVFCILASLSHLHARVQYDPTLPNPLHVIPLQAHKPHPLRQDRNLLDAELTPLYPGYGTHISYLFVGTPPQRQSVIIDTGSAYTAFPCTGCQGCGQHTDTYFNPKNSSTAVIERCGVSTCAISQSYSEGSSWRAYRVTDKLWVGGLTSSLVKNGNKYQIDFSFGCQTSETGLFRTQLADGIMGMSRSGTTLLPQLFDHKVVNSKIFGLCFRIGGGIMTIGGIDQSIHSSDIMYAKLYNSASNWFRINVEAVSLIDISGDGKTAEVAVAGFEAMNGGSGTIVDSGTTDSYFPSKMKAAFETAFLGITGVRYSAGNAMVLTAAQVKALPSIKITVTQPEGGHIDLIMPASAYSDFEGGKYTFRIYLTESSGSVLGANFMRKRNIIFDADGGRVGFADSSCNYEDYSDAYFDPPDVPFSLPPIPAPIELPKDSNNCSMEPAGYCSAVCDRTFSRRALGQKTHTGTNEKDKSTTNTDADKFGNKNNGSGSSKSGDVKSSFQMDSTKNNKSKDKGSGKTATAYVSEGLQIFFDNCNETYVKRPCTEYCTADNEIARGASVHCLDTTWSECGKDCTQHRMVGQNKKGQCSFQKIVRSCAVDNCPQQPSDFFVFADLKFWYPAAVSPRRWEKIYEDDLFSALSAILKIPPGNMDMFVDMETKSDNTEKTRRLSSSRHIHHRDNRSLRHLGAEKEKRFVKLQLQVVISRKLYPRVEYFNNAVQFVLEMLETEGFRLGEFLIPELAIIGKQRDGDRIYRYSMLYPEDITVQRAVALPMGGIRDPINVPIAAPVTTGKEQSSADTTREYLLIGVLLGCVVAMSIVCMLYCRLKSEYAALAKEKVLSSGTSIIRMLNRVAPKGRKGKPQQNGRDFFPSARGDGSGKDLLGAVDSDDENAEEFGL